MWHYLSTGAKIGLVGAGLGAAGGIAAALVAALSGPGDFHSKISGLIVVIVFVSVVILIFFFVYRKVFGPVGKQGKLQRTGLPADATILEVRETGWTVNQIYPVVKLKLEVRPPGGQPYQAEIQTLIGRLDVAQIRPGAVVAVKYDPRNPSKVALADTAPSYQAPPEQATSSFQASPPPQAMEEFLKKNDEESQNIRRTGKPAPAVIIQATPLNVFVNGRNPAMTFILDVQPEGQPAFQAQVTGVIGEASVPKYRPGRIVYVKYDPADLSRVSLDHS